MRRKTAIILGGAVVLGLVSSILIAQGLFRSADDSVALKFADAYEDRASDAKIDEIVAAAQTFIGKLNNEQKKATLFPFTDNGQRGNWSNLPEGVVRRGGVRLGTLSPDQRLALNELLAKVLSDEGARNVELQLAADDTLGGGGGIVNFGSDHYFASFLGEPSTSQPWMFQFGGHHLAINVTFFGPNASFSPMLTGGQPLQVTVEGKEIHITERELTAAQAFMNSLSQQQRQEAIRSDRVINLLLGPGEYGAVVAPEGIRASVLTSEQKALLLAVIEARLGFINEDDFRPTMAQVESDIDESYFGWWGPLDVVGGAYFRVSGPSIVMEYAPQQGFGGGNSDGTDHAHNMYRDPRNDYGSTWISVKP